MNLDEKLRLQQFAERDIEMDVMLVNARNLLRQNVAVSFEQTRRINAQEALVEQTLPHFLRHVIAAENTACQVVNQRICTQIGTGSGRSACAVLLHLIA